MSKRSIDDILDGDEDVDVGKVDRSKIARIDPSVNSGDIYPYSDEGICPNGGVSLSQFLKIEYMRIRDAHTKDGILPEHAFPITLKKEQYVVLAIMTPKNGVDTHMIFPYFYDAGNRRVLHTKSRFDRRNGDAGDMCAGPLTRVIANIMSVEGQIARGDEKVVKSLQAGGTGLDGLEQCAPQDDGNGGSSSVQDMEDEGEGTEV